MFATVALAFRNSSNVATPVGTANPLPVQGVAGGVAVPVTDAAAESSLSTLAGTVSGGSVQVSGLAVASSAYYTGTSTLTRANNQTPYSIGDVVGGALTIANVGPSGGGDVLINAVRVNALITALPSGMGLFNLEIYSATPPSALADNSPWTRPSGDDATYMGEIAGIMASAKGTGTQRVDLILENINQQFNVPSGGALYAYLVTQAAFTPAANSEQYNMRVKAVA